MKALNLLQRVEWDPRYIFTTFIFASEKMHEQFMNRIETRVLESDTKNGRIEGGSTTKVLEIIQKMGIDWNFFYNINEARLKIHNYWNNTDEKKRFERYKSVREYLLTDIKEDDADMKQIRAKIIQEWDKMGSDPINILTATVFAAGMFDYIATQRYQAKQKSKSSYDWGCYSRTKYTSRSSRASRGRGRGRGSSIPRGRHRH